MHALLQGRQQILLRKGGIHEKAFETPDHDGGFLLFPTVAHAHAERTRAEHQDLIALGAADVTDDAVVIRAGVHLVGTVEVQDPTRLPDLEDLHIWTSESIQRDRVAFRPTKPLTVMVVQVTALPTPLTLPRRDSYGGCTSWLDLHTDADLPPLEPSQDLLDVLERVQTTLR